MGQTFALGSEKSSGWGGHYLVHLVCWLGLDDVAEELKAEFLQLESGQVADH